MVCMHGGHFGVMSKSLMYDVQPDYCCSHCRTRHSVFRMHGVGMHAV
jgi:hypothetical protein